MDLPNIDEDLDLALRHVTRLFPVDLARALLPPGAVITTAQWTDTQITSRQRRLDRAIEIVADGACRFEHLEIQLRWRRNVPLRVFEYQTMLALALAAEKPRRNPIPTLHSTVVLLSGRRKPWPRWDEYRLSSAGAPFSGVSFRVEAVYQRTVAELSARGPLWMVFAPLAVDADAARMKEVISRLRSEVDPQEFGELAAALTVVATKDQRQRGLREAMLAWLSKEDVMRSAVFELGKQDGKLEQEQHFIVRLYEKRLGRPLADAERATLLHRLAALGADRLVDVRDELPADALAAWLRQPDAA